MRQPLPVCRERLGPVGKVGPLGLGAHWGPLQIGANLRQPIVWVFLIGHNWGDFAHTQGTPWFLRRRFPRQEGGGAYLCSHFGVVVPGKQHNP